MSIPEDSEYVGEHISDDGVRVIERRIERVNDVPCEFCSMARRVLIRAALIFSVAIGIHFFYAFFITPS